MAQRKLIIVFVHGWSVTNTSSYGGLPVRLQNEAKSRGLDFETKHLFLSRYISFHDEVQLSDVSRAFRTAVEDELRTLLDDGRRFVCITHSTGGPVIRDWWHRYYDGVTGSGVCPMSHLVMLAPANHGSALARLGKGRISRLKSWFGGVEPGEGILDWLELGSADAWDLNSAWIERGGDSIAANGVLPFVLTGQTIDRKFYDHLNSYTGESGSDGVVRVAAANLESRLIVLEQQLPKQAAAKKAEAPALHVTRVAAGAGTALRVVRGAAHSGRRKGIMRGVHVDAGHAKGRDLVDAVLECIAVKTRADYRGLAKRHSDETDVVQREERLEIEDRLLLRDEHFVHDRYSMVTFRVSDDHGYPVRDFDLLLTGGEDSDPDKLPRGFFMDRQLNRVNRNTLTYYFNYDIMAGAPEVSDGSEIIRPATRGATSLGFRIVPRPADGFVRYLPCEIRASKSLLGEVLQPNSTTLVDIRLRRVVTKNVFRMSRLEGKSVAGSFKRTPPGDDIVD